MYPIALISELGHFGANVQSPVEATSSVRYSVWCATQHCRVLNNFVNVSRIDTQKTLRARENTAADDSIYTHVYFRENCSWLTCATTCVTDHEQWITLANLQQWMENEFRSCTCILIIWTTLTGKFPFKLETVLIITSSSLQQKMINRKADYILHYL